MYKYMQTQKNQQHSMFLQQNNSYKWTLDMYRNNKQPSFIAYFFTLDIMKQQLLDA